jgi:threonine dehydrogenase-like Zn-dependent dehydrogenase
MTGAQTTRALWFTSPRHAEILEESIEAPRAGEVLVRGIRSIVSSGTEMRVYRGEVDPAMPIGLETFRGSFTFPVKYAYQIVGEIEEAGGESGFEVGQRVFARHPHQERFVVRAGEFLLFGLPDGLDPDKAAFSNLLAVRVGDVVVVYGQGVIGSFVAQLARRNAGVLIVVDPIEARRTAALELGADAALDPADAPAAIEQLSKGRGADISFEVSGAPAALQAAIRGTGQEGTIAVVSFFGGVSVPLVLSPEFHFRRQRIVSSQVRQLGSGLQPRWSLERRMQTVFGLLARDEVFTPISHVLPFDRAPEAYALLDSHPGDTAGILISYD